MVLWSPVLSVFQGHNPTIVHVGDAVGEIENAGIMGDRENGTVGPNRCRAQKLHDRMAGSSVEG